MLLSVWQEWKQGGGRMESTAIVGARENLGLDHGDNNVSAKALRAGSWWLLQPYSANSDFPNRLLSPSLHGSVGCGVWGNERDKDDSKSSLAWATECDVVVVPFAEMGKQGDEQVC